MSSFADRNKLMALISKDIEYYSTLFGQSVIPVIRNEGYLYSDNTNNPIAVWSFPTKSGDIGTLRFATQGQTSPIIATNRHFLRKSGIGLLVGMTGFWLYIEDSPYYPLALELVKILTPLNKFLDNFKAGSVIGSNSGGEVIVSSGISTTVTTLQTALKGMLSTFSDENNTWKNL